MTFRLALDLSDRFLVSLLLHFLPVGISHIAQFALSIVVHDDVFNVFRVHSKFTWLVVIQALLMALDE